MAPEIALRDWIRPPGGKAPTPASLAGKVVMLEFWGTWCAPCVRAMPHVQQLHDRYAQEGLVVLAISYETTGKMRGFLNKHRYTMPVGSDPDRSVVKAYGVRGWPTSFVIGKDGKIAFRGGPYGAEPAIEKALGLPSTEGGLLLAYLDARPAARKKWLVRLGHKAKPSFDLAAWARDQHGKAVEGTRPLDRRKALDVLSSLWDKSKKRDVALSSLASMEEATVDLASWVRKRLAAKHRIGSKEMQVLLDGERYDEAIEAILTRRPESAASRRAAKHGGLARWCKGSKADEARTFAKKGLMAQHWLFSGRKPRDNQAFFRELSVSGFATSKDKKQITGVLIAGATVDREGVETYVHDQLGRALVMEALARGKPPKTSGLEAQIQKQRKRLLRQLKAKYGGG